LPQRLDRDGLALPSGETPTREQLVDQFVADGHGSSFWMFGSFLPFDRLHKI
jgi:hypothetical protein